MLTPFLILLYRAAHYWSGFRFCLCNVWVHMHVETLHVQKSHINNTQIQ